MPGLGGYSRQPGDTRETGGRRPLPEVGGSAEPPGVEGRDLLGGDGWGVSHAEVGTPRVAEAQSLLALTSLLLPTVHAGTETDGLPLPLLLLQPPEACLFASRRCLTQVGGDGAGLSLVISLHWVGGL